MYFFSQKHMLLLKNYVFLRKKHVLLKNHSFVIAQVFVGQLIIHVAGPSGPVHDHIDIICD